MTSLFDQGSPEPCPTPFNLAAYVLGIARAPAGKVALEVVGQSCETWTYDDLRVAVPRTAAGLLSLGLKPGDKVLMRLGNLVDFPIGFLACIYVGLIPVPTAAGLTSSEITRLSEELSPKAVLWDGEAALPESSAAQIVDLDALRSLRKTPACAPQQGDPNRLAYIVYTSGTGGKPRGVCHAHRALWARQMMIKDWYDLTPEDRVMHAGAFNWTYTLGTGLLDPWSIGATALICAPGTKTSDLGPLMIKHRATIFAAAPGVYRQMLRGHEILKAPDLRHGLSAGEKLPEHTADRWRMCTGRNVYEALGMSECSTFISGRPKDETLRADASGWPQTGRRIAVLDGDGECVPFDTQGVLAVSTRDPGLMLNYLGEPPLAGDWFKTGDIVSMSEDFQITYHGRDDDMMNAGGFRVSPLEVEGAFAQLNGAGETAAVELSVSEDASVIALFHTSDLSEEDLKSHAKTHLARYKQPRLYIACKDLPKGANGKLNRRALRDSYEAQHGQT
jgi:acyl-coenzyme A synthetase/AMP-(fatty) acid ligase